VDSHVSHPAEPGQSDIGTSVEPSIETLTQPTPIGSAIGVDGRPIMLGPPAAGFVPAIDAQKAVAEAQRHVALGDVGPSSVTAELARFGDGDNVWAVVFDGICTSVSNGPPGSHGPPCPITRLVTIVNASTGAWSSNYWG